MSQRNTKLGANGKQVDLNCPAKKPVVPVEDDIYGGGDFSDDDGYFTEGDPNAAYATPTLSANTPSLADQEALAAAQALEAQEKAALADNAWDYAEVYFNQVIDLSQDYVAEKGGSLKLADKGKITLSVQDGQLQLGYRSNEADFRVKAEPENQNGKLNKKKAEPVILDSDIVKSIYLTGFKMEGWSDNVLLHMTTVPKFKSEGHFGNSVHVNKMIMPHEWVKPNHRIKIADRAINKGMMDFQKKYPGCSPENLAKSIQKNTATTFLVDLDSPLIGVINKHNGAHVEGGQYLNATIPETNQVLVTKAVVKTYMPKTLKSMSYGISYGNVTNNRLSVSFEAPIPHHLLAKNKEYEDSKGTMGRQYMGFADPYKSDPMSLSHLNSSIKTKSTLFKEAAPTIRISGKLEFEYLRSAKNTA